MCYPDKGIDGVGRGRGGERIGHVIVADEGDMIGSYLIGRASLARENEVGDSWGQEVHILHVNI